MAAASLLGSLAPKRAGAEGQQGLGEGSALTELPAAHASPREALATSISSTCSEVLGVRMGEGCQRLSRATGLCRAEQEQGGFFHRQPGERCWRAAWFGVRLESFQRSAGLQDRKSF